MYALGKLLLSLCCRSHTAINAIGPSIEFLGSRYSAELKNVIVYLLSKPTPSSFATIEELCRMTAVQTLTYMDSLRSYV